MYTVIVSVFLLSLTGILSGVILYFVAKKFQISEDPRIDAVEAVLPGVNCGGCGYPGCRKFAEACVLAKNLDNLFCPVGGNKGMIEVSKILGLDVAEKEPKVAVVRCNGSLKNRPRINEYDGEAQCKIVHNLYTGETGCSYGCLGFADCVRACKFDAITINKETLLPVVDEKKCVACGACVKACPRHLIELRYQGKDNQRVFVSCSNPEKGSIARKNCSAACIGCGKCFKACAFDAIKIGENLAYIDFKKCTLCRKCVSQCPTGAIHEVNFKLASDNQVQETKVNV
ncbi:MAG: RnfABCDGE type electron transport complex subunit B [Candidatus Omnitrophota bacterium]